jgi:hypothetical protein
MTWAQAKHSLELNWRDEWQSIAAMTQGERDAAELRELSHALKRLSALEDAHDRLGFLREKDQLQKLCSPGSIDNPAAMPAKPTEAPTPPGSLTLWDAIEDASLRLKSSGWG